MTVQKYNVVGVMSGTSLDGVDLAHIIFSYDGERWHFEIKEAETTPYKKEWIQQLKTAVSFDADELNLLNAEYTILLSSIIKEFLIKYGLKNIDAVCSHGHTILHQPHNGFTLQIGNLPEIAQITGVKTVCDFRVQDVQLGGQGAPLVPIGDRLLFGNYDACLNLGGFSNISFEEGGKRIAYDICAVNTVLNHYANKLGLEYDAGGDVAASAEVNTTLLKELNSLEFYSQPFPKSLGFEFVKETILPLINKYDDTPQPALATFTAHVAVQISNVLIASDIKTLLVTGGGAYNSHLIDRLRKISPGISIEIPDDKTIQFKEALIFGLLGVLKIRGEVNVLASVTGAKYDHTSGIIHMP